MMKYSVTRQTLQPSRAHKQDAGVDVYVPDFTQDFVKLMTEMNDSHSFLIQQETLTIYPHQRVKLPTGLHFNVPAGNMLLVLQKTSVPNKTGIISGARVIDQNYQGQFIASLINTSDRDAHLCAGHKFIQLVLVPVSYPALEKTEINDLYEQTSQRGIGAYGSTGHA